MIRRQGSGEDGRSSAPMLLTLYFIVLFHLKDLSRLLGGALLPFLEVPVTERIDVYLLRLEGSLQSFQDARECVARSETENVVDNRLLVQLVNRVSWERSVEPEDYRILNLPVEGNETFGNKMIRRVIVSSKPLVKLEALANLDHGRSPPSMQRYLGR